MSTIRRTIFTFWEPRGSVTPYLQLCRETWNRWLGHEDAVAVIDYQNLEEYVGEGVLEIEALRQLPLAVQKDAVMVATLRRHGGLFLDMDTLIVDDLSPVLRTLRRTEVLMFDQHLAFVAARPGARLMDRWLDEIRLNLARISSGEVLPSKAGWNYLGNAPLTEVYRELLDRSFVFRALRHSPLGRRLWPSTSGTPSGTAGAPPTSVAPSLVRRTAKALVRATHARQLIMLDRIAHGFIVEARELDESTLSIIDQYRSFWFGQSSAGLDRVFRQGTRVIALHHTWTPEWFSALSREEVLAHDCLLSKTLARLLQPCAIRLDAPRA